jgi:hypothetical protein
MFKKFRRIKGRSSYKYIFRYLISSKSNKHYLQLPSIWRMLSSIVRTDVSEKHIASIFKVNNWFFLVRREDVPHEGRGREPLATVPPFLCLSVAVKIADRPLLRRICWLASHRRQQFYDLMFSRQCQWRMLSSDMWPHGVTASQRTGYFIVTTAKT